MTSASTRHAAGKLCALSFGASRMTDVTVVQESADPGAFGWRVLVEVIPGPRGQATVFGPRFREATGRPWDRR